jgi:hypothetical protein
MDRNHETTAQVYSSRHGMGQKNDMSPNLGAGPIHDETAANGPFKINWLMEEFQLTPLSASVANSWNTNSLCTDVVFTALTTSSIMSKNCNLSGDGFEIFTASNLYDSMAIFPDGLADSDYDQGGGDTPETRRTQINWNLIFEKADTL